MGYHRRRRTKKELVLGLALSFKGGIMPDLIKEKTFSLVELIVEDENGEKYEVSSDYVNENINTWIDNDDVKILHFYRADKN